MKCPYCGKDNTRVIDSRPADDGIPSAGEENVMNVINGLLLMKR